MSGEVEKDGPLWWKRVFNGNADWKCYELLWRDSRLAVVEGRGDRWFGNLGDGWTGQPYTQLCRHVRSLTAAKYISECKVKELIRAEFGFHDIKDAERYRWLRSRDLDTIGKGGVFAGMTPKNVILNLEDLDREVDAAMRREK